MLAESFTLLHATPPTHLRPNKGRLVGEENKNTKTLKNFDLIAN